MTTLWVPIAVAVARQALPWPTMVSHVWVSAHKCLCVGWGVGNDGVTYVGERDATVMWVGVGGELVFSTVTGFLLPGRVYLGQ